MNPNAHKEHERQLSMERTRYEAAENGRLQLEAELDLIR